MLWLWVTLGASFIYIAGVVCGAIACLDNYNLRRKYPSDAEKWAYGFLWPFVVLRGAYRGLVALQRGLHETAKVFGEVFRKVWSS